jgi:integrase
MPKVLTVIPRKEGDVWRVIVPKNKRPSGSKRMVRRFPTRAKAQAFCDELNAQNPSTLQHFFRMNLADQESMTKAWELAGNDARAVLDAVHFYKAQKPKQLANLKELAVLTVDAKQRAGKTDHYCNCLRRSLQLFIAGREDQMAHSIQPHHIESWINSDAKWTPNTKRTYLRDVTTMFSFGVKNGHCVENPALKVEKPSLHDTSPMILMVPDCERLMRSAERVDPELVQYLAFCLFAGLRPSEAARITKENMKEGAIEVFGKKVRARNRRLVPINPTLKAWLVKYPGDFEPVNLQRRIMAVRNGTGSDGVEPIRWTQDCLRHTFVSMHYAIHGAKETAIVAGHSETVLFQHYRELVPRTEAEKFWSIVPKL